MMTEPPTDLCNCGVPINRSQDIAASVDRGTRAAESAIRAGKLKFKEYPPLPMPPGHGEYVRLLGSMCGVGYELANLPAGVTNAAFIAEVRGWNNRMTTEIERKFGPDILLRVHREAQQQWLKHIRRT